MKGNTANSDDLAINRMIVQRLAFSAMIIVLCVFAIATDAHSFDGHRKGFILGFGVGPGIWYDLEHRPGGNWGVHTDLKIGLGINDQILLHYSGKQFTRRIPQDYVLIQPSLGASYYMRPQSPTLFGVAGLGITTEFAAEYNHGTGRRLCIYIGAGYEFASHWNIELNAAYNTGPQNINLALTINALGY